MLLNPKAYAPVFADEATLEILKKTIEFFETKGLAKVKDDDHGAVWYADFLEFQKGERIFARLLTPSAYSEDDDARWDTWRNNLFSEILGFYGLAYWYTWQVSILGLGPIWQTKNEPIKHKTAGLLEDGGVFAFGLSERAHGADLYSSEMSLTPQEGGGYLGNGEKYYIGNANKAALVSTFGKMADTDDFVFFAVDSKHRDYDCVRNVCESQNYVAQYALHDYPVQEEDILSKGRDAWDAALNTVNVGKVNLGWASIGMCTHAFYEAIDHASGRNLFGSYVTDFVHIKRLFVDAWARLVAMKAFALRAADYQRTASNEDRRYLLYSPMVKMKVTCEGERVINHLWDVIAAKGFEKDTFFSMAARDIRALPKLEGTVHVNMALIIKFMANYFFKPGEFPEIDRITDPKDDVFLFDQGPTKGLGKIRFHDYKPIYKASKLANVRVFRKQVKALKQLLLLARPSKEQTKDFDFLLILGELFTLTVYGQLILENAKIYGLDDDVVEQIFDFMIRDFSGYALELYGKGNATKRQRMLAKRMISRPVADAARYERNWTERVFSNKGAYKMNE
jgi:acyl-CoA dehydrogenase